MFYGTTHVVLYLHYRPIWKLHALPPWGCSLYLTLVNTELKTPKDSTKYVIHGGWQNGCSATIEGDGIGWRAGSVVFLNLAAQRALVMASKTKFLSSPIKCDCPPAYLS